MNRPRYMRRQLVMLVVAVAVPMLVLQLYELKQSSEQAKESAYREVENQAAAIAQDVQNLLVGTEQYLAFLSVRPMILAMDSQRCEPLLEGVEKRRQHVANVFISDLNGKPICFTVKGPGPIPENLQPYDWYRLASASKSITVSKPFLAPVVRRMVAAVSQPLIGSGGLRIGTITVLLDLESVQSEWSTSSLPPNSRLSIIDGDGIIVTTRPDFQTLVGKDVSGVVNRAKAISTGAVGVTLGLDGVERAFALKPILKTDWLASASIPTEFVFGPAERQFRQSMIVILAVVAGVLALAMSMARRMIGALSSLVFTARSVSKGRTDVRASEDVPGEFREVAHEFNAMLNASSRHNDFYRALSRSNGAIVRSTNPQSLFEEICRACVEHGHASIAYVSLVTGETMRHVAWAGPAENFVRNLKVRIADRTVAGSGLSGLAAYTNERQISNNVHDDPRTLPWREFGDAIGTKSIAACPFRSGGKTAGTLTLHMTSTHFFDERVIALLAEMTDDVSFALDNFAQADALSLRERQLAGLVDTAMDAIISIDAQFKIRLFNRAAGEMFLVAPDSVLGSTIDRFVPARLHAAHDAHLEQFSKTGSTARRMGFESLTAVRSDGTEFPIEASISRLVEGDTALMTAVVRDMTNLRAAQEAKIAQVAAESASRAKTDFLSRMSHELRTPLNAVLGFSQLLQSDEKEPMTAGQYGHVDRIRVAGWHLLSLINDVLDVSRIEGGHVAVEDRQVDVLAAIEEAVRITQTSANEASVRIISTYRNAAPTAAWGDPKRLRQVMINLLSNAIKYNRLAGSVEVRVSGDAEATCIDVIDTGMGMSSTQLEHLYEPFNRLGRDQRNIEGTGLGLALTRQLVELMRGQIVVQSEVDRGTTVRVTLRTNVEVDSAAAPQGDPTDPESAGIQLPRGVVLYIEDNPVNFILVEHLLLRWPDVTLLHAENGKDGLAIARATRLDLMLLDMRLPDLDGLEVLKELRSHEATAPYRVVALSASAMPEEVEAAERAGALCYWTKPLDFDQFLADMARLLAVEENPVRESSA
ncbi:MAG: ATP-binding protein [Rhizobacter sp.]